MNYEKVKKQYFRNTKAICDEESLDVDKRSIVFYQYRYGIESFMPDFVLRNSGVTDSFPLGAGYRAYRNVLNKLTKCEDNAKITPHIDNKWHRKEVMPEIDIFMEIEYTKWSLKICYVKNKADNKAVDGLINENDIYEYIWNLVKAQEIYMDYMKKNAVLEKLNDLDDFTKAVEIYKNKLKAKKDYAQEYLDIVDVAQKRALLELQEDCNTYKQVSND